MVVTYNREITPTMQALNTPTFYCSSRENVGVLFGEHSNGKGAGRIERAKDECTMPDTPQQWNFRENTDQVYRLLRDLAQNLPLWGRFFDAPLAVVQDYGLHISQGIVRGNLSARKRPSVQLFASALDWSAFDARYLSREPAGSIEDFYRANPDAATEISLTLSGAKPVARLSVDESLLGAVVHFLERTNAPFVLAPFKTVFRLDERKGGYSNLADRNVSLDAPAQGMVMIYVSLDGAKAQAALLLESLEAHGEFGRALGYPECCVQFFAQNFSRTGDTLGDLAPFSLRNTTRPPPYPFYLNNLARYFGVRLVFHFPCQFTCAASAAVGRRHFEALQKDAPQLAEKARRLLLCPILYTDSEGVFLLEEFSLLADGHLAYHPERIRATDETSPLYQLLRAADRLKMPAEGKGRLPLYRGNTPLAVTDGEVWCLTFTEG